MTTFKSQLTAIAFGLSILLPTMSSAINIDKQKQAINALQAKVGTHWTMEWNPQHTQIITMRGQLSRPNSNKISPSVEKIATDFLKENHHLLHIPAHLNDLQIEQNQESLAGFHLRMRQHFHKLPVFNGEVEVHLNKKHMISLIHSNYLADINLNTTPALTKEAAIAIAEQDSLQNLSLTKKTGEKIALTNVNLVFNAPVDFALGIFGLNDKAVLAYKFSLSVDLPEIASTYIIDANTGAILEHWNLIQHATGKGKVFDPNPVNVLNNTTLRDRKNAASAVPNNVYSIKTLKAIGYNTSLNSYLLRGSYIDVNDNLKNPKVYSNNAIIGHLLMPVSDFFFTREDYGFEQTMVYWVIDENQRYIQSLGFKNINNRAIKVDPHATDPHDPDNSQYVSNTKGTGHLEFGEGGVDDAEDADIILHEYGHAIQDNQTRGRYYMTAQAGAMGEGFGDYWAASNTYATSIAHGFDPACIGEWDQAPYCLRRVDSTKHYPEDISHEVHNDGEIWSAVLWELFNSLGKTTTDQLVLQSHFLIRDRPKFIQGGQALLDANQALVDSGVFKENHQTTICQALSTRGIIVPSC